MKRTHLSTAKQVMRDKWDYNSLMMSFNNNIQEDKYNSTYSSDDGLVTWPPKNYTCSFCKREFRSAQALGGHMNVHRRDRARLRQLPSWIFEIPNHSNPNFNTNPSFSSSSASPTPSSSSLSPCSSKLLPHASFCKSSMDEKRTTNVVPNYCSYCLNPKYGDLAKDMSKKDVRGGGEFKNASTMYAEKDLKKCEVISLELEMGFNDPKQVLDLELRLGYFN